MDTLRPAERLGQPARPIRLAYVVSHPIQYQAELLRRIAADPAIELLVMFCSDFSTRAYQDRGFGVAVEWDVPLTAGYRHVILPRWRDTHDPGPTRPISRGFFRSLRRGIDGEPFDAMWVHGYSTVNALHAIAAARVLGIPVLLRAEPWLSDRKRSRLKLRAKRIFFAALRRAVAGVLPIGTRNARYWAHYFGEDFPSFPMPYAVNNEFFAEGRRNAAARRPALMTELALDSGRPVILFASKLQTRKHCDHLLAACLRLYGRLPEEQRPHLLIVGDGEQMAALQAQAAASPAGSLVRFAGFRNQRELPRFFEVASIFVLPSRHEAWGLIVNEAMAAGLPVIVSQDVGCAADLLRDGENGFTYPFGNIPALEAALAATLAPGRAAAMGERSREIIANWSYAEDLAGLKQALRQVTRRSLPEPTGTSATESTKEPHAPAAL